MADYYQLFSEVVPTLTEEEKNWVERVLNCTPNPGHEVDAANALAARLLQEAGLDLRMIDLEVLPPNRDFWVHGDESGNVLHLAELVRAFLSRFRPSACWHLTWAETCSRPRCSAFGGGGLFVTAHSVEVFRAADWTEQRLKAFEDDAATCP